MLENYKVVAVTPVGKRKYLEILLPYIIRDRGLIDEYHIWINTSSKELDFEYINHLKINFPDFIRLFEADNTLNENNTGYQFYQNCVDEKTLYLKIDNSICFIESGALNKLLTFRIKHPEYFLVYANIVNNAGCSCIHERLGNIPIELKSRNHITISEDNWKSGKMAANVHKEFIRNWENNTLITYKYSQWILNQFERISVNLVCWFGEEFAKFGGNVRSTNDDEWLSETKPKEINKFSAICGEALVSHFAYSTQSDYLEAYTKYLTVYKQISWETARKNNLFQEIEHIDSIPQNITTELIDTELEQCINKIRNCSLEQLQNPEWLENNLLLELGLNNEVLEEFPEHLYPYCGYGLKSWQYPNQFSKYLVWLSQQKIRSYLEIGCRHGGTFIITVEYLERFGKLDVAVGIDIFYSELMKKYALSKDNVTYLELASNDLLSNNLLSDIYFDLVLVDGDHSEEGVIYDYNLIRKYAKFIAFHDIVNVACPGVVNLWQKLKKQYSHNIEFIDQYPSLTHKYLGIGLIDTRYCNYAPVLIAPVTDDNHRPFWSVMIPTYNCAVLLAETLKSVLAQDPGIEEMQIEVVDDCSTKDDPEAIVKELGQGRVSFFRKPRNGGAPANFNTCVERAKGKWVHILHGDDTVLPGFYNSLRAGIEQNSTLGAAFTRYIHIDGNSNWRVLSFLERDTPGILNDFLPKMVMINRIMTPSIVVKRSVYEELGGFNLELIHSADWDMWRRVIINYPIWFEPTPLACYREHIASDTSFLRVTGTNITDGCKSIDVSALYLPPSISQELLNQARENHAILGLETAKNFLAIGDIYATFNQIRAALKCYISPNIYSKFATLLGNSEDLWKLTAKLFTSNYASQIFIDEFVNGEAQVQVELESREINLIAFPDWQSQEELLYEDLTNLFRIILTSPQRDKISLLIDNSNLADEDVSLMISDIMFSLIQQEDLNIKEEPAICLLDNLNEYQWKFVLDQAHIRVVLQNQNKEIITKIGADELFSLQLSELAIYLRNRE